MGYNSILVVPPKSLTNKIGGPNNGPVLSSAKISKIFNAPITSTGDNVLYVVPAGKRATIAGIQYNPTLGTINVLEKVIIGGVTFRLGASVAQALNTGAQFAIVWNSYPILEAGDSFVINVDATGLNLTFYIVEFNNTECLKSPRVASDGSATTYTLYTCPANKRAYILNMNGQNGPVRYYNGTAGTRTYNTFVVPSGQSPTSTNKLAPQFTVTTNNSSNQANNTVGLAPGDSFVITTDSGLAGQLFVIQNLIEIPI